jgi:Arc/MetJ-type ribon-helix-helix transcriptional regulator
MHRKGKSEMDNQVAQDPEAQKPASEIPANFEEFLEAQPETVKALYNSHSEALMNTVRATRDERDNFAKQIKQLTKGMAEGSEAKTQLEQMSAQLEKTERRAAFLEEAFRPEVQCRNARAAWLLAEAGNLFDKKGNPDWSAIKADAPELFGVISANANAGAGTAKPPAAQKNMNDFIRRASGRT